MKGQFYAPLVGAILVALAIMMGGYALSQEKSVTSSLSNLHSRVRYITYGEIADHDVWTSLESYVRVKIYRELENSAHGRDFLSRIESSLGKWIKDFYQKFKISGEFNLYFSRPPSVRIRGRRILANKYIRYKVQNRNVELTIVTQNTYIHKPLDGVRSLLLSFPLRIITQLEKEAQLKYNKVKACFAQKRDTDFRNCEIHDKTVEEQIECMSSIGIGSDTFLVNPKWIRAYNFFDRNSWRSIPKEADGVYVEKTEKWNIPGLNHKLQVKLRGIKEGKVEFLKGVSKDLFHLQISGNLFLIELDPGNDKNTALCNLVRYCGVKIRKTGDRYKAYIDQNSSECKNKKLECRGDCLNFCKQFFSTYESNIEALYNAGYQCPH